jgi:hypothetical protein
MKGAKAVENQTAKVFSSRDPNNPPDTGMWTAASRIASLDRVTSADRIVPLVTPTGHRKRADSSL